MSIFNFLNKNNSQNKLIKKRLNFGLTMVESLVAISILTIAVIGPLSIIAQALQTSYYTRDQMTAHYLAQEAIEYVRNMRDRQGILITKEYLNNMQTGDETLLADWKGADASLFGIGGLSIPASGAQVITRYNLIKNNMDGGYKFTACSGGSNTPCAVLKKNSQGIFGYNEDALATDSVFTREIYFERGPVIPEGESQEIIMTVNVYWKNGSSQAQITIKESLTNWPAVHGL